MNLDILFKIRTKRHDVKVGKRPPLAFTNEGVATDHRKGILEIHAVLSDGFITRPCFISISTSVEIQPRPGMIEMGKVLLINGSPNEHGCTYTALSEMASTFEKEGVESEIYWIGKGDVPGCKSCRYCKKKGRCVIDDQVNALAARLDEFDGIVIGAPVYYAGPSGQSCAFMDRLFYSADKSKLINKPGTAIVSCRRGGASSSYDRLLKYFSITSMPIVSSQYWNQVHGNTPDEVRQDLEGLQTMRTLARNMAWLIKCIDAGKAAGIPLPERETPTMTNFIRPE